MLCSDVIVLLLFIVSNHIEYHQFQKLCAQSQSEEEQVAAALPAHMIPDNYDTNLDICLMGENFRASAIDVQGFEWLNEGRDPLAPKWGYTASTPNASIVFTITHGITTNDTDTAPRSPKHRRASVLVILAYLRSYENMGVAAVSCSGGCVCGEAASRVPVNGEGEVRATRPNCC
ncbi:hypothetical protein Vretifemale_6381 [Volvox reticuliferus]|uniref:Uncharacterized protein n=1 Tax=Volvox reticuliferus TaxID=1737510 RepID=A0A8J4FMG4_9CHLO|nr:hypothetical protein Vretifemale_6381 [Volvox reticuliferus]